MNNSFRPEPRPHSSVRRKTHKLLMWVAITLMLIGGITLLEAEHRSKIWKLWPLLLFLPIPLLTWLNYRRENARWISGTSANVETPSKDKRSAPAEAGE